MTDSSFTIEATLPSDEKTALMSNAALGCYIKLMCFAWRQGSIPDDPALLARLCGEPEANFSSAWPQIAPCFFSDAGKPGRLFHASIERQRELATATRNAKSAAGSIGAQKRWAGSKTAVGAAVAETAAKVASVVPSTSGSTLPSPEPARVDLPAQDPQLPFDEGADVDLFGVRPNAASIVVPRDPNRLPSCPHVEIIALYHELMPMNPKAMTWNASRQGLLAARWKEMATTKSELLGNGYKSTEDGLKWWRAFLGHCAKSSFLTGQAQQRDNRPPFVASLEWICRPNNFAKVLEGQYHRGAAG